MRPVIAYIACLISLVVSGSLSAAPMRGTTLLLQFEQPGSERTLQEVRSELTTVMREAGFTFDLKLFSELSPFAEFNNLMVIRMKGRCKLDAGPAPKSDGGALAFTHTSDGKMLPFIEVACDRIRGTIRPVMWGEQFRQADALMGRALARVIAHEIYHIMTGTSSHGEKGIARHSLSGQHLIADHLAFDPDDIERMATSSYVSGGL